MFIIYIKIHYNDIIMHQTNHNRQIDWGRIERINFNAKPTTIFEYRTTNIILIYV